MFSMNTSLVLKDVFDWLAAAVPALELSPNLHTWMLTDAELLRCDKQKVLLSICVMEDNRRLFLVDFCLLTVFVFPTRQVRAYELQCFRVGGGIRVRKETSDQCMWRTKSQTAGCSRKFYMWEQQQLVFPLRTNYLLILTHAPLTFSWIIRWVVGLQQSDHVLLADIW